MSVISGQMECSGHSPAGVQRRESLLVGIGLGKEMKTGLVSGLRGRGLARAPHGEQQKAKVRGGVGTLAWQAGMGYGEEERSSWGP